MTPERAREILAAADRRDNAPRAPREPSWASAAAAAGAAYLWVASLAVCLVGLLFVPVLALLGTAALLAGLVVGLTNSHRLWVWLLVGTLVSPPGWVLLAVALWGAGGMARRL